MEFEYSNEVKGAVVAYRFEDWEKQIIAKSLAVEIARRNRKIKAQENHPKNDGQIKFQIKIEALQREITEINKIVTEFSKP